VSFSPGDYLLYAVCRDDLDTDALDADAGESREMVFYHPSCNTDQGVYRMCECCGD